MSNKINLKRSLTKGIIWELIGLVILYVITRSFVISLSYVCIRIILYPFHEFLWKKYLGWYR